MEHCQDSGAEVLIRAWRSRAGFISVAPGVELPLDAVEVMAEIPNDSPEVLVAVLPFDCVGDRERFSEEFAAWLGD